MGDDALSTSLDPALLAEVRKRYLDVNGDHPMTPADDAYVRDQFVPVAADAVLEEMLAGRLPLPSYLLSDGTPMVPADHGDVVAIAGGADRVHDWFVAFWPEDPAAGEEEWGHYLSGQYVCLREVSPIRIKQKTERVAEASAAADLLRCDPHDPVGRGMLGEAVDGVLGVPGLDSLLRPMTAYDRLRFGVPTVRERFVDAPREAFLTPVPPVWPLRTERLVLRPFAPGDAPAFVDAWASEQWTSLLLSLPMNAAEVAEMARRRSNPGDHKFIGLVVERDGEVVGDSMLHLQGTGLSEAEIGWTVLPQHLGHGYATEAAREVLRLAFEHHGVRRVVANLDARNDRSAAVCERIGMRRESHRLGDFWSKGRWTDSLEYAVLRDEWLAARG